MGVAAGMEVFGGVFANRRVAATHMATCQAHAQMHPAHTAFQTFFAAFGIGGDVVYLVGVCTLRHGVLSVMIRCLHACLFYARTSMTTNMTTTVCGKRPHVYAHPITRYNKITTVNIIVQSAPKPTMQPSAPPRYKLETSYDAALIDAKRSVNQVRYLIWPHQVTLDVVAVDADVANVRVVASMMLMPGLAIPQMAVRGQLARSYDNMATLDVQINPLTIYRLMMYLSALVVGLVMLRVRVWLGAAYFVLLLGFAYAQTVMLLNSIDQLLKSTFGHATPLRRKAKRKHGHLVNRCCTLPRFLNLTATLQCWSNVCKAFWVTISSGFICKARLQWANMMLTVMSILSGVLQHDLTDAELRVVEATHLDLWQRDLYWAKHIEGSYFPADILRNPTKTGLPLCYVDNGATEFERSDHCNTLVVRVTLRDDGLCFIRATH